MMAKSKLKAGGLKRFVAWVNGEPLAKENVVQASEVKESTLKKAVAKEVSSTKEFVKEQLGKVSVNEERKETLYRIVVCVIGLAMGIILLTMVAYLPSFGGANNPASNEVVERYIESGVAETGAINLVAGMILDYRAFDTFGESNVLFLAVTSVVMLLKRDKTNTYKEDLIEEEEDAVIAEEDHNELLQRVTLFLFPLILLFGVYVVLNGHLSPGGGFSGGAIIGAGLILYDMAYGSKAASKFFNFKIFTRISVACLLTYCLSKTYSFFVGANHLPSIIPLGTPGAILSAGLILPLNICVGMVVACTMYGFYCLFTRGEM